jgi:methionine-rich copper-binding protein CopC
MSDLLPTMSNRRRILLSLACAGAAAAGCFSGNRPARAHAALVRSDPSRRAVLTQPPGHIRLWFSERIELEYSSISILDAAGQRIPTERAAVSPTDAKLLILDLPPLTPGQYTVRYRINSIDGHILESSYQFVLKAAMVGE